MQRIFKILLIIILIFLGLLLGVKLIIKEAFGPKHRTIEIELANDRKLICEEIYNADLAAVFYNVEFILRETNKEDIKLGQASFLNENWEREIELIEMGDWIILPIRQYSYSKILLTNQKLKITKDTIFSPLELRYDEKWRNKYGEIPAWTYEGESKIDSIVKNDFYVNYKYRIGIDRPFKLYNQTVSYEFDLKSGFFMTDKIFDRTEK